MKKCYPLILIFCLFSLSGCGVIGFTNSSRSTSTSTSSLPESIPDKQSTPSDETSNPPTLRSLNSSEPLFLEEGVASWYGPNFNGKKTANGETYDMYDLTAAHRTLAFNSIVRVTNLENGKSIDVRINDRGPYAKQRIIDLSKKAATDLDMIASGTARVRLSLVEGKKPDLSTFCSLCETFGVQLGAFKNEFDAEILKEKVEGAYIHRGEANGSPLFRVLFGAFADKADADRALTNFKKKGFDGLVRQLENL